MHQASVLAFVLSFLCLSKSDEVMAQNAFSPRPGQLLISEVLFHPSAGGADYVEVYNNSYDDISLDSVVLVKVHSDGHPGRFYPLCEDCDLSAHCWLVVTTDAAWVRQHYTVRSPEQLLQVDAMPALANGQGTILLALKDSTVLDRLDYTEKMHTPLLRDKEGVALERCSYDAPTQQPSNWSSAATIAGYGTPTYRNSLSTEFLFTYADFMGSSDIISPDGDGRDDILAINYTLKEPALMGNFMIFDSRGRLVRHLAHGLLLGAQGSVVWDGRDDNNIRCFPDNYIVFIDVFNTRGLHQQHKMLVSLMTK